MFKFNNIHKWVLAIFVWALMSSARNFSFYSAFMYSSYSRPVFVICLCLPT